MLSRKKYSSTCQEHTKKSDIINKSILSSHFYTKVSHDKRSSNFMCLLRNNIKNVSMGWLEMNIYHIYIYYVTIDCYWNISSKFANPIWLITNINCLFTLIFSISFVGCSHSSEFIPWPPTAIRFQHMANFFTPNFIGDHCKKGPKRNLYGR